MAAKINIGDTWKNTTALKVNINDSWKTVTGGYINIGDTWEKWWPELTTYISGFTSSTTWTVPAGVTSAQVLVVAGGGGGGRDRGGGGGGGGVVYNSGYTLTPGSSISITIGSGGASAFASVTAGSNGGNSVFGTITAYGGGGGGKYQDNGLNGGCGGGTGRDTTTKTGGTGSQGYGGGKATASSYGSGGGGGGAGGAGYNGGKDNVNWSGNYSKGGIGAYYGDIFGDIYGENGYFSGGGAGGWQTGPNFPTGGLGGGGDNYGCGSSEGSGINGMSNTGGGAAGTCVPTTQHYGGSGIVLIKYQI